MHPMERARAILVQPKREWHVIEAEPSAPKELYTGYIVPLAAIGPVASIIGTSVIGVGLPAVGRYRLPIGAAVMQAVVAYILTLGSVYVLALIIDVLAPRFAGQRNSLQALKVAAYSSTAAWVAGVFALIPPLSILRILGLYSIYLLYLGLPVLMKVREDKSLGYTIAVVIAAIVIFIIIGAVSGAAIGTASPTIPTIR